MEREGRQQAATASASASQSKYKCKAVIETPGSAHSSQEMEALQKGEEFKQGLANLSDQIQTHVQEAEPQPKKKKTQLVSQQAPVPTALMAKTDKIPQQVLKDQQRL